ncbi:MAG: chromosome segregation protein SMC [Candidatus Accumulibacter sp.]|jgi:chromosome segregation protein|nr:chromosome segregation protein SMC [Accumulibacter sp.]
MRLIKLKLAGFKSFVDPTTLALPGQLVGVVGPNGCGKSNVIDAVRWVLGESKASELRGESMQDVIFNGSGTRKAVSRASVELVFDNSQGRVAGQWSQYAELAVKRVLTRNGQSEYFINNLQVRRKDITDLFLGTGLGPRAYAIIGQGTISRIIEARPDELRVFLEEAAGVTKYKERRKETEGRLSDARENLVRVEDIRLQLGKRMETLEGQAEAARRYHEFHGELTRKQHLLWLYRRREAQTERERLAGDLSAREAELEAKRAEMGVIDARKGEASLLREEKTDALGGAQTAYNEANAEVARLELEIRHRDESREEYESRLAQLADNRTFWQAKAEEHEAEIERWSELLTLAAERVEQSQAAHAARQEELPLAEEAHAAARAEVDARREAVSQADKGLQVEIANREHARRSLQILAGRRERLRQEREALPAPDEAEVESHQAALAGLRGRIADGEDAAARRKDALPQLDAQRREAMAAVQQAQKERAEAQARRNALEQLQRRAPGDGDPADWLRRRRIDENRPLWRALKVESGWETAVEAVLRERLHALPAGDIDPAWARERAPARLTLLAPREAAGRPGKDSLRARIVCADAALAAALDDWLAGVFTAPDLTTALHRAETLEAGQCCVTPAGDVADRQGVAFFAPDPAEHGLLERQREIEKLAGEIDALDERVRMEQQRLAEAESRLAEARAALEEANREIEEWKEEAHAIEVETLRLRQMLERFRDRQAQIDASLEDMAAEEEAENERLFAAEEAIAARRADADESKRAADEAQARLDAAEAARREKRERVAAAERDWRDAQFSLRECQGKCDRSVKDRDLARQQLARIESEMAECEEKTAATQAEDLEAQKQAAVARRVTRERELAAARDALASADGDLRGLDENRMRIEQELEPLRARIDELRLKEQAAAINYEQYASQLLDAKADEAGLARELETARPGALKSAIDGLQRKIEELGNVNLAALEELESVRTSKADLDAHSEDLTQAIEKLEVAIHRIDRETRELLRSTFEAVNRNLGELFPTLFGGGEARLIMTGEEILDAGLQVMAQPPGKKNSTIHLLSGGEKALTAIALVFSLFRLNPAPFCLLDEVDAPLDDTNTERFCAMVRRMADNTQFLFISHNKIAMEMARQLVGVTMQESGVSRIVEVDMEEALRMREQIV